MSNVAVFAATAAAAVLAVSLASATGAEARKHRHHHHHRKQKGHGPRGLIKGAPLRTMDLKTTLRHADSPMRATAAEELQAAEAEVRHHDDARQRMHRAIVRL